MTQKTVDLTRDSDTSQELSKKNWTADGAFWTPSRLSDSIVRNVNVWLDVLDTQLNIVFWNGVAETTSGYSQRRGDWPQPDLAVVVSRRGLSPDDHHTDFLAD